MALTLKSKDGCAPNPRLTELFDKLCAAGAAGKLLQDQQEREYDVYHEKVTWQRLKAEREKDLVLMFGDDDVRVFHRGRREGNSSLLQAVDMDESFHRIADRSGLSHHSNVATTPGRVRRHRRPDQRGAGQHQNASATGLHARDAPRTDEVDPMDRGETPAGEPLDDIPVPLWSKWIRSEEHKPQVVEVKKKKSRRRHHRKSCRFHPLSSNATQKQRAQDSNFPKQVMRTSASRLQHAANGSSSGVANELPLDEFFVPPEIIDPPESPSRKRKDRTVTLPVDPSASSPPGTPRSKSDIPIPFDPHLDDESPPKKRDSFADDLSEMPMMQSNVFLTETRTVGERCRTPSLARFGNALKPHANLYSADFVDCSCSDRSTDDEYDDDEDVGNLVDSLTASAARAERKLDGWRRQFKLSSVQSRAALDSILTEREAERDFVVNERKHLNILTKEAEACGAAWRISRQIRSTTPFHGSVWKGVYNSIADDTKHLNRNRDHYVVFLESCNKIGFPSDSRELAFVEDFRMICRKSSAKQVRLPDATPPPVRFVPKKGNRSSSSMSSRPVSRQSAIRGATPTTRSRAATPGVGTRSSALSPISAGDVTHQSASTVGGNQSEADEASLFMVKVKAKPTGRFHGVFGSGPGVRAPPPGEEPPPELFLGEEDVLTQKTFYQLATKHGSSMVQSKRGVHILNMLREICGVPTKDFLTFIYAREDHWQLSADMHRLHKTLTSSKLNGSATTSTAASPIELSRTGGF